MALEMPLEGAQSLWTKGNFIESTLTVRGGNKGPEDSPVYKVS